MAAIMSSPFGRLLEPGLRKIFMETYKEVPEQYSQVFNVQNSNKAIETDLRMGGFGLWDKKDSAGSVQYQDTVDPVALQYIHEEFASGFVVERKFIDDEQYNQIGKMSGALARSARSTIEVKAAQVLNTGIAGGTGVNAPVNGFDGVPLISASHVRLDGGGMSNILAAANGGVANGALSDRNLKAALVQFRAQVDDKGILIQTAPKILVVPPSLEYIAKTLIQGSTLSTAGTGSGITNDINTLPSLKVVVMDYLTSATSWFLIDPTVSQLNFFWRKKLEFENDRDFNTKAYKYSAYMRFSVGYSDYRGIFGSLGSGAA